MSQIRFRADNAHERVLSIISEINFSKNAKETAKKNSEEAINQEISHYQKRMINLQDDYANGKISLEDYDTSIERYRQKVRALQLETKDQVTQTD